VKRSIALLLLVLIVLPAHLLAQEPIDRDVVGRIRRSGTRSSWSEPT